MSFFKKLKDKLTTSTQEVSQKFTDGLTKTRDGFASAVNDLVYRFREVDEDFFDELEDLLIQADVGVTTTMDLVEDLKEEVKRRNLKDPVAVRDALVEVVAKRLQEDESDRELNMQDGLTVILFVGVNGVGKTTTIGKLAHQLKAEGRSVMLAAGDTFRAGAIDQLQVWGERAGVPVIRQAEGSDPAAVVFDAVQAAKSRGVDVLICDTAGRLQNKVNLMKELEKVKRVIEREVPNGPHEVLLALDATTGQNAMLQAKAFQEATNVSGIVLTKLDGTAKGGIVLAIRNELDIPVKYVGLGEKIDDLQAFDPEQFVLGLFGDVFEEKNQTNDDLA
ncbi:signal recognition particle-docking protein FtsY [Exiguobacterium sp. SH3S2]|uniref:signal recognition particle-docking protein FtsY n=1 Tax=Exiguobacterium TaxID=33986 RepID=UPI0008775E23|nr:MULTISPECIES: signal recognition particle-docking protein FtsY [Exiguobacterium]TCI49217.1 signal recognition particle-docking protein FtsY [Exiguobacterium sp. SH3S3]TCI64530.1 signal recognition particle-docking protein FtsY [Exiguobacterium sp. SH3S2]TCI66143.1 signal recognition particle-docking protein FtsY [Exiguobacterium sp. SH3S1]TCI71920.1 signal recognition particle-docking protein FtsY [Exiguobacterium sp. SH0S7]